MGSLLSSQVLTEKEPWITGFTVDPATGIFTKTAHGFTANPYVALELGDGTGKLPTGLNSYTVGTYGTYYLVLVQDENTFILADPYTEDVVKPSDIGTAGYVMRKAKSRFSFDLPEIKVGESLEFMLKIGGGLFNLNAYKFGYIFQQRR